MGGKEGRAKIQHVQTGLANDTEVIINDGLNRGSGHLNPQLKDYEKEEDRSQVAEKDFLEFYVN